MRRVMAELREGSAMAFTLGRGGFTGGGELKFGGGGKGEGRHSDGGFIGQARCGRWKGSGRSVISVLAMWARWLAIGAAPLAGDRRKEQGKKREGNADAWGQWGSERERTGACGRRRCVRLKAEADG